MAMPDSRNDRDYRSFEEDALSPGDTRRKVSALIDPSQIPVPVAFSEGTAVVVSPYGEILALASGSETTIVSYTVPALKKSFLQRVEYSGENLALYRVKINGSVIAKARTWWTGDLKGEMIWQQSSFKGYPIVSGDIVTVTVIHSRPMSGDFESRILIIEDDV